MPICCVSHCLVYCYAKRRYAECRGAIRLASKNFSWTNTLAYFGNSDEEICFNDTETCSDCPSEDFEVAVVRSVEIVTKLFTTVIYYFS